MSTAASHLARIARAAVVGLALGLLGGGVFLLTASAHAIFFPMDCLGEGPKECAVLIQSAHDLARYQASAAGALMLLGVFLLYVIQRPAR